MSFLTMKTLPEFPSHLFVRVAWQKKADEIRHNASKVTLQSMISKSKDTIVSLS